MKKLKLFLTLAAVITMLSGCFLDPAESLYAIPEQSADYYNLQRAIEKSMPEGASYSAPTSGENQQPVQMADLDGDQQDEAIVYWKNGGDLPLSISIFDKREEEFLLIATLDGVGYAFDHVQYVEIDGNPGNEIVVGRQLSNKVMQTLNVYALQADSLVELMSANYTQFITTDLDADGLRDVMLLHTADAKNGVVEFYHWNGEQLARDREARMSTPVSAVKRIIAGKMSEGIPAVFVASEYGEGMIVTDIFGIQDNTFTNFSLSDGADTSVSTIRDYYVYSCDIDSDGLIELPRLISLAPIARDENSKNQTLIQWYNLLPDGTEQEKCKTYHNYSAGWYLQIPDALSGKLSVTRTTVLDSVLGYTFCQKGTEIFTLAAVSAEKTDLLPEQWRTLATKGETSYVLCMGSDAEALSEKEIEGLFHFIRIDWKTGETD